MSDAAQLQLTVDGAPRTETQGTTALICTRISVRWWWPTSTVSSRI